MSQLDVTADAPGPVRTLKLRRPLGVRYHRFGHLLLRIANHVSGFIIIVSALFLGSLIAHYAAVPVPGNILGMTILLLLLAVRIVPVALVSPASTTLLALLPSLFVPLYVPPFSDKAFWLDYSGVLLPVVGAGCAAMIILARGLAAAMIRR